MYHGTKIKIYLCLQVTQYQFTILKIWRQRKEGIKTKPKNTCGFLHYAVEYSTLLKQLRKPLCVRPNIFSCKNQTQSLNSLILTLWTMAENLTHWIKSWILSFFYAIKDLNFYCKCIEQDPRTLRNFQENISLSAVKYPTCSSTKVPKFDLIQAADPGSLPGPTHKSPFPSYPCFQHKTKEMTNTLPKFKHIPLHIKTSILYPYTCTKIRSQFHSCHTADFIL